MTWHMAFQNGPDTYWANIDGKEATVYKNGEEMYTKTLKKEVHYKDFDQIDVWQNVVSGGLENFRFGDGEKK